MAPFGCRGLEFFNGVRVVLGIENEHSPRVGKAIKEAESYV